MPFARSLLICIAQSATGPNTASQKVTGVATLEVPVRCKRCCSADLQFEGGTNLRLKAFTKNYL